MSGTLTVVVGGQFGSEGKGHVAGRLAQRQPYDDRQVTAVRVAGPNAGHSAYDAQGRKWALRCIPVMAVTNLDAHLVIAAGSEIDPAVLFDETEQLEDAGIPITQRLYIDQSATVITPSHKEAEGHYGGELTQRLGSTGKGVGAARAERVWRRAPTWGTDNDPAGCDTSQKIEVDLALGNDVIIEGTQGYGLGVHTEYYPFCTSSDCRAMDFIAMAGISPWGRHVRNVDVWVVLRTHPIRVAGNSGPLRGETTWDELGIISRGHIKPEKTTVTQVVRRVGAWDRQLAEKAILANGGPGTKVALTFFDYWFPELAGVEGGPEQLKEQHKASVEDIEKQIGAEVCLLGTSGHTMIDLRVGK